MQLITKINEDTLTMYIFDVTIMLYTSKIVSFNFKLF